MLVYPDNQYVPKCLRYNRKQLIHVLTIFSRKDLFKEFGIELSFVATRSGLTRWEEHKEKNEFEEMEDYEDDPDNPREP